MKKVRLFLYIFTLVFSLTFFVSCKKPVVEETYKVEFLYEDGSLIEEKSFKGSQELESFAPEKEGYTFIGWYLDGKKIELPYIFESNAKVIAKFEINTYQYQFLVDGEIIKQATGTHGSNIEYPKDPTKESTAAETYVFVGWDNDAKVLLENEVFNAVFSSTEKEYTYTFEDANGEVIKTLTAKYGTTIEYPENPTKESTAEYNFEFVGWDKEDKTLIQNVVFKPIFNGVKREYTYTFEDANGEVIKTLTAKYGTTIEYPENPTKEATAENNFEFVGWDKEDKTLTQDIVFKPIFNGVKREYTYKFLDYDGSLIKEAKGEYGTLPVEPEVPKREGYKFIGWNKEVSEITGDVEYTAVYKEVESITSLEGLKVSILGDSISTFYAEGSVMNSYYDGENEFFYPRYSSTIKTVEKTWWYQLITNNKMELGINNSLSGSAAAGNGNSAGQSDARINTIDDNGSPDVVIIFLGTNDCGSQYINLEQYEAALKTMIEKINALCDAEIFVTSLGHATHSAYMASRDSYNASIKSIAKEYGCTIVPLDDYIVEDNCKIYLEDSLHYNAKGAALLAKIYEKTIKEHFGITFEGEIEVEHQEKLPEGVLGKITATAGEGFWVGTTYAEHVFLESSEFSNALYSLRIQIVKNAENGKYYVSSIHKSGDEGVTITGDYVLTISSSHPEFKALSSLVENVVVGSIVEFNEPVEFPVEILFKEGDGNAPGISEPEPEPEPDPEPDPDPEVPEDAIAYIVATANTGFYSTYTKDVFLAKSSSFESAIYSFRYQITKSEENGKYYVTGIHKSGDTVKFDSDYVITISESHENRAALVSSLSSVEIGSIVEFDETLSFPVLVVFKAGDGNAPGTSEPEPEPEPENPKVEGQLHVGSYNTGIWTVYEDTAIIYTQDAIDKKSTFINFYIIKLVKEGENYKIAELKTVNTAESFNECDYYVLIYKDLEDKSYYESANVGDIVVIHGDPTSGSCNLEFK